MDKCERAQSYLNHLEKSKYEYKVLQMIKQVCLAVEFIHSKNYVHRDIKLDNILVKNEEVFVLTDFGTSTNDL
jgi:myosin-light-chain kinase